MEEMIEYIVNKITKLRTEKGISERQLSLALGHNAGYINSITNKKTLPSLNELLYMFEYFNISPKDFFDESNEITLQKIELLELTKDFDKEDFRLLVEIIKRFDKYK